MLTDDQNSDLTENPFSYAQDPCANLKTGFGYSVSSKHTNEGSINFIKGETINLQNSDKNNIQKQQKDSLKSCDTIKGNAKFNIFFAENILIGQISCLICD